MAEPMPASPEEAYKWSITIEADTVALERQRKEGQSRGFTVYCDDSDLIGGDNSAPPPLSYFTMALGFSLLTEVSRYGRLMQVKVHKARVHITAHFRAEGSVSEQTVQSFCDGFETRLEVESDEPPERVAGLIRNAENGCYALQTIRHPVPLRTAVVVNGAAFDLAAYPPPQRSS